MCAAVHTLEPNDDRLFIGETRLFPLRLLLLSFHPHVLHTSPLDPFDGGEIIFLSSSA